MKAEAGLSKIEGLQGVCPAKPVFADVSFARRGEFVCIIGHSGCGKTTILNVLAGAGHGQRRPCVHGRREVAGPSLERGVVFQGHALMPWLTVRSNIAFAVRRAGPSGAAPGQQRTCGEVRRAGGPEPAIDKKPSAAVGRHEAARGHRARVRHPAQDAAARRALRRARRADARHHPGRAAAHLRARRSRPCS
jgi:nitrate/nitrite transport system ATP-binding protein